MQDERVQAIETQMACLVTKIGEIHKEILGNGQPERSHRVRLIQLEKARARWGWNLAIVIAAVGSVTALIAVLVK